MGKVAITALNKLYDGSGELAVKDVSLTVADGEFMVLLGPSGCGKSSVLRMIAGLEPITSGTVAVDGKIINEVPAKDRDIAMVFQSYALYPHMDVFNNLAFGLRRRGVARHEIERRVQGAADETRAPSLSEAQAACPLRRSAAARRARPRHRARTEGVSV